MKPNLVDIRGERRVPVQDVASLSAALHGLARKVLKEGLNVDHAVVALIGPEGVQVWWNRGTKLEHLSDAAAQIQEVHTCHRYRVMFGGEETKREPANVVARRRQREHLARAAQLSYEREFAFPCPGCRERFKTARGLRQHDRIVHIACRCRCGCATGKAERRVNSELCGECYRAKYANDPAHGISEVA